MMSEDVIFQKKNSLLRRYNRLEGSRTATSEQTHMQAGTACCS